MAREVSPCRLETAFARREKRSPDGRAGQLVNGHETGLQPRVGNGQVVAGDKRREQGRRRSVAEDLGRTKDEHHGEHDGNAHCLGEDRDSQQHQDGGTGGVDGCDHHASVHAVGQGASQDSEEEPGQPLQEQSQGHEGRVVSLGGDEQWPGGEGEAVAQVRHPR